MSDIVSELLDRAYSHKPNDFLCERATMEIERLRTLAEQATHSEGSVQDRCTLTAEEREAILTAADLLIGSKPGATLRKLLERLHT
jgi:hypothetical protein